MLVQLTNVTKQYKDFHLNCTLEIPEDSVTGLIGANGAGKSTTFKTILGLIHPDGGTVRVMGKESKNLTTKDRQEIGTVLSDSGFSGYLTVAQIAGFMGDLYPKFNRKEFEKQCVRFKIPMKKKLKEFSTGMRAKLKVLLAVSYQARLLILDEPTAGLDVTAREDILDLLRAYMEVPGRAILISSHISSDLEQFCDDIYMIDKGQIMLHEETDVILESYGLLKMSPEEYAHIDKDHLLCVKQESFGYSGLTDNRYFYQENYPQIAVEKGSVDEVISMIVRGETL